MAKLYVSNKDETPRLFQNDFLEKLSRVHPSVPLILYLPLVAFLLYRSANNPQIGAAEIVGLFALGVLFWTFMEYVIHRFAFHYEFKSEMGKRIHFLIHGIHHDYPRDSKRLVMPPSVSIPLAILFYGLFRWALGVTVGEPSFAGFVFGYVCYDSIHYVLHHWSMRGSRLGLWLQQHHNLHHYQDPDRGYGVSTPLWDYVFGTMPEPIKKKKMPVDA